MKRLALIAILATGISSPLLAMPFGGTEDVNFAKQLWDVLKNERLVGEERINVKPFEGSEPHGTIQQVTATTATVNGRTARVLVKANHGGKDIGVEEVYDNPNKYLGAYTVMFKREAGYDSENKDWFWAKFTKNGEIDMNPKKVHLAGRVAKGSDKGCIACHVAAGGEDLETLTAK